ncbi:MAG TPA: hypothetical protein GXZ30_07095 [Propionibacterium sp.]|nr:hypothetical protein [Propionibacterium sp.]
MHRLRPGLAAAFTVILLAGCSATPDATPAQSPAPTQTPAAPTEITEEVETADGTDDPGDQATSLADAMIEADGVGPIRIGMSLAEAQAHGWAARSEVCDRWDASPALIDQGLSLTFLDDRLYEIWVHEPTFGTAAGIKPGDSLEDVQKAYGEDLRTEEREGAGGRLPAWFVVDDEHELLFVEVDPGKDQQIKAILARTHGTPVIEGC